MKLSRRTLNIIHALTLAGCALILGMTLYTWRTSGRFDATSIAVALLIVALVALQRMAHGERNDNAR